MQRKMGYIDILFSGFGVLNAKLKHKQHIFERPFWKFSCVYLNGHNKQNQVVGDQVLIFGNFSLCFIEFPAIETA